MDVAAPVETRLPVTPRYVEVALVKKALVPVRSEVKNDCDDVALREFQAVEEARVAKKLVVVALVVVELVIERLAMVEEALMITLLMVTNPVLRAMLIGASTKVPASSYLLTAKSEPVLLPLSVPSTLKAHLGMLSVLNEKMRAFPTSASRIIRAVASPLSTWNWEEGLDVPIPTLPVACW